MHRNSATEISTARGKPYLIDGKKDKLGVNSVSHKEYYVNFNHPEANQPFSGQIRFRFCF